MAAVLSFAVNFFSRKSRNLMVCLEAFLPDDERELTTLEKLKNKFSEFTPMKKIRPRKLWVKSLVFIEEGGRRVECLANDHQLDPTSNLQQDLNHAVCELDKSPDKNGGFFDFSAMISVKPIGAISSVELVLEITPNAEICVLENVKIIDPAYPIHPLLYSASWKENVENKASVSHHNFVVLSLRCDSHDISPPTKCEMGELSKISDANLAKFKEFIKDYESHEKHSEEFTNRNDHQTDFVSEYCTSEYCTSRTKECGEKIDLKTNEKVAYYILEGTVTLTVNKKKAQSGNRDSSSLNRNHAYKICGVPAGTVLFRNLDLQFSELLDSIECLERCRIIEIKFPSDDFFREKFVVWVKEEIYPGLAPALGELFSYTKNDEQEFSLSVSLFGGFDQDSKVPQLISESSHHLKLLSQSRLDQEMTFDIDDIQQDCKNIRLQVDMWRTFTKTNPSKLAGSVKYKCHFQGNFTGFVRMRLFGEEDPFVAFPHLPLVEGGRVEIGIPLELKGETGNTDTEWLGETLSLHLQILQGSGSIDRYDFCSSFCAP
jgi:hypothetical protein